ncbi:hypothetical protein EYC84_008705 [Monilinia fructicola]|uniref:Uncharacterized protein n=1 Tax=Monilinia fructicola TaxID=38448 RepID=A0A5M9JA22_MONFR|nr:hypothetical protein EYC84_008705 [Monilinia fructicola]
MNTYPIDIKINLSIKYQIQKMAYQENEQRARYAAPLIQRESELTTGTYDDLGHGRIRDDISGAGSQDVNERQTGPEPAVTHAYFDDTSHNLRTDTTTGYHQFPPLSEHAQNSPVYL